MFFLLTICVPLFIAWLRNGNVIEGDVSFLTHLSNSVIDDQSLAVSPFILLSFSLSYHDHPPSKNR